MIFLATKKMRYEMFGFASRIAQLDRPLLEADENSIIVKSGLN